MGFLAPGFSGVGLSTAPLTIARLPDMTDTIPDALVQRRYPPDDDFCPQN
jgi:hypothetical protein